MSQYCTARFPSFFTFNVCFATAATTKGKQEATCNATKQLFSSLHGRQKF